MKIIRAMIITFSMYSKLPMPRLKWAEEDMKYSLLFFPFIGAFIGVVLFVWWRLCDYFSFGIFLKTGVAVFLPILITGGIHMDGFLDTTDALSSFQSKEKKLEILKDPHSGAFAIIGGTLYFILYFAFFTEIKNEEAVIMVGLGFILSRTLSGLALVWFRSAKKDGLLYAFSSTAHKKVIRVTLSLIFIACILAMAYVWRGKGLILAGMSIGVFVYYRVMSYNKFGGITGDLAGYFLQLLELSMVIGAGVLDR